MIFNSQNFNQHIFTKIITIFLIVVFTFSIAHTVHGALVDVLPCAERGCLDKLPKGADPSQCDCGPCDFVALSVNASNIIVGLSGTFSVLMFVYGGIVMLTAYGNESRVKWGKDILVATVIGILIVLLAWTFINLLIGSFFGSVNPTLPNWGPWSNPNLMCAETSK